MSEPRTRFERWSLRRRFTLLSTVLAGLAEVAVFAAIIIFQGQLLRDRFDDRLCDELERVAASMSLPTDVGDLELPAVAPFGPRLDRELSLAVLSTEGDVLVTDTVHLAPGLVAQVVPRLSGLGDLVELMDGRIDAPSPDGEARFRIAMRRLEPGDRAVTAFCSTDRLEQATRTTATAFLVALPVTLIVIVGATWYVSGLVMRPIEEVRDIAERLAPDAIPAAVDLRPVGPEVRRLETELAAAMARIQTGFETQSRFMMNVAHELKTPISVIVAEGQTLSSDAVANDEARRFIESTIEEMRRLGRLIESFLALTRVPEQETPSRRELVPVNELVMSALGRCRSLARTYGVELVPTLLMVGDEALVRGDGDLLGAAVDNLVSNAVRFSGAGDRVEISVRDTRDTWSIEVRDYGPGIPPELLDRLFDRFAPVAERHRRRRGCSLELEIAQGIVERHGGGVVASNETPGCRFVAWLPKAFLDPS